MRFIDQIRALVGVFGLLIGYKPNSGVNINHYFCNFFPNKKTCEFIFPYKNKL